MPEQTDHGPILPADPGAAYRDHPDAVDAAIRRVLISGSYVLGDEAEAFEKEFAAYTGEHFGIGVASGTDALTVALRACGVGVGDEVITASFGSGATATAIALTGAIPVLADIDEDSFCLSPSSSADLLTHRTKAVVAAHLYGHPADMDALSEITRSRGISLVEDAAQAHGARLGGRPVGSLGDVAAFSFYPTKNLGAVGDAGMVVTGDAAIAERARQIRQYGWKERQVSDSLGINSRLDAIQAAVLRARLPYLDAENGRRRKIASLYRTGLAGAGLRLPVAADGVQPVYHQFAVRSSRRDALRAHLAERGIGTGLLYPRAIHQQPAFVDCPRHSAGLAISEAAAAEVLCLPIYPQLSDDSVMRVASAVCDFG